MEFSMMDYYKFMRLILFGPNMFITLSHAKSELYNFLEKFIIKKCVINLKLSRISNLHCLFGVSLWLIFNGTQNTVHC